MLEAEEKIVVKQETLLEPWKKVNQIISSVFTLIIIAVFPLFFRNYYFDILTVKYIFYLHVFSNEAASHHQRKRNNMGDKNFQQRFRYSLPPKHFYRMKN